MRQAVERGYGVWRPGSVIRSWLVDLMEERYRADGLKAVPPVIEDTAGDKAKEKTQR